MEPTASKKRVISNHIKLIGRRIRLLRKRKGLSLKDLAKQVGCSYSLLSLAERGFTQMEMDKYLLIAEALDVDPALLLSKKELSEKQLLFILNAVKVGTAKEPTHHFDSIDQLLKIDAESIE